MRQAVFENMERVTTAYKRFLIIPGELRTLPGDRVIQPRSSDS